MSSHWKSQAASSSISWTRRCKWLDEIKSPIHAVGWAGVVKLLRINCPKPYTPIAALRISDEEDIDSTEVKNKYATLSTATVEKGWHLLGVDDVRMSGLDRPTLEFHLEIAMKHEGIIQKVSKFCMYKIVHFFK